MAGGAATTVDTFLCSMLCFLIGKLQYSATSDNGDNKIGCKTTKISWKERPEFWPQDICFVNPNTNLTTPKKWSMLFAALSCLLRKDIDTFLSKKEKFVLCVEMMALECSNLDILKQCHALRKLMQLDLTCLKVLWVKEIFLDGLRSFGLPLAETFTCLECNRLLSLYDDLEKECRNGQLPDFLKKLKSFRSMKSLDADVALNVAKECLEHESTRTKRPGSSPGHRDNNKKSKTSENSSQKAGKQATGTTVQSLMIQTTASAIPTFQTPVMQPPCPTILNLVKQTTVPPLPTTHTPVNQATASSLCSTQYQGMQTTVPPLPTTHTPVNQATASSLCSTQYQGVQTTASQIPNTPLYVMPTTIQNAMMQTTASSMPTIPNPGMQRTASPLPIIHNQVMPTTAPLLPSSQNPVILTFASSIPTTQSPVIQSTASPVQPTQSRVLRPATSHLRSQLVCATSVISTQTTATTPKVSPVNTNNPLLSSSGSHEPLIPLDTSSMSLHDQARNTFQDNAFPGSSTWTPRQEYCVEPDSASTLFPDLD